MKPVQALKFMSDVCMSTMINLSEEAQQKVLTARNVLKEILPKEEKKEEKKDE